MSVDVYFHGAVAPLRDRDRRRSSLDDFENLRVADVQRHLAAVCDQAAKERRQHSTRETQRARSVAVSHAATSADLR